MYLVTPKESHQIDTRAIEKFNIPGLVLMENAAVRTIDVIFKYYNLSSNDKVIVVVGGGNNGGDGLAIARHIFLRDIPVEIVMLADVQKLPVDAKANLDMILNLDISITTIKDDQHINSLSGILKGARLIIDAIFGTGLSKPVKGRYLSAIEAINKSNVPVVSVDIPSGIDGETGHVMGSAVKADHTVTYGYSKPGQILYPGRIYTGCLSVVPISLPIDSPEAIGVSAFTFSEREIAYQLKERPADGHKGTFGRVGVIAGSIGMTGAAYLTSMAAQKSGAGLVTLAIPSSLANIMSGKLIEVMVFPVCDNKTGHMVKNSIADIEIFRKDKDVLAVGPGIGKNIEILEVLRNIFESNDISIVVDADALNNISEDINILYCRKYPTVITPHPGEMARLTGKTISEIVDNPVTVGRQFAMEYGIVVLLKGAATVVASPDGRIYINQTGNSGMGTGGSGDVLTGIVASFIAQGYDPFDAAVYGCFIHGMAGDIAADQKGQAGMLAGDIVEAVPLVLKKLYTMKYE